MGENRDSVGRFRPGHAGGPGRPRGQTISAELRRQADPEAIAAFLLAVIADPKASTKDKLAAAAMVVDRLEGKATARIEVGPAADHPDLDSMTEDERLAWAEAYRLRAIGDGK